MLRFAAQLSVTDHCQYRGQSGDLVADALVTNRAGRGRPPDACRNFLSRPSLFQVFRAGPGNENVLLQVAAACEASNRRIPPPAPVKLPLAISPPQIPRERHL